MNKKLSKKSDITKLSEALDDKAKVELDPNIIEFEKEAKLQEKQKELEQDNKEDKDDNILQLPKNKRHNKSNKARAIIACFVLLLAVGVGGNWYFENSSIGEKIKPILSNEEVKTLGQAEFVDATTELTSENEYFTKARVDRQNSRDETLEKLQALVDNQNVLEQDKTNATNSISQISRIIGIENKVETLVCAKGIKHCLAIVSDDAKKIDIIVDVEDLNEQIIMQIKDVAIEQLGCTFEDVTIIKAS